MTYELVLDKQSRPQATNVSFVGIKPAAAESPSLRLNPATLVVPGILLAVISYGVLHGKLHPLLPLAYIGLSCIAYMNYAFDKAAAVQGQWRTAESTLHLISLLGGWPGAMIAQSMFRHKTKKLTFRIVFWATVAANCGGLGWFLSPYGASALSRLVVGE